MLAGRGRGAGRGGGERPLRSHAGGGVRGHGLVPAGGPPGAPAARAVRPGPRPAGAPVLVHGALQPAVPAGLFDERVGLRTARQRARRATRLARSRQAASAQAAACGARASASVACRRGVFARARQASFAFDCLDVKDALVGAPYLYEADLMNRRAAQGLVSHTRSNASCPYATYPICREHALSVARQGSSLLFHYVRRMPLFSQHAVPRLGCCARRARGLGFTAVATMEDAAASSPA